MNIRLALIPAISVVWLFSGCSDTEPQSQGRTESVGLIDFSESDFQDEPVNRFEISPMQSALGLVPEESASFAMSTMQQLEVGIEQCMESLGFPYEPHVTSDDVGNTWLPNMTRLEFASVFGFGSSLTVDDASIDGLVVEDPNRSYLDLLDVEELEAWEDALFSREGCRTQSGDSLWGDETANYVALDEQVSREVSSHLEVRQAAEGYVDCTRAAGYDWLNNPWISNLIGLETASQEKLSLEEEVAAALADLECLYPAELIRRSVRFDVETKIVEENSELLTTLRTRINER